MIRLSGARCGLAYRLLLGLLLWSVSSVSAEDEPQSQQRLEFMKAAVEALEPQPAELKSKPAFTFASKPLLRYSDPTRGGVRNEANVLLDGSVWRLGTEGRPTALVTVELYQAANGSRALAFEFLSMSETTFSLKHKSERVRWDPADAALKLKVLPDAPKPASTAAARLVQMRQLARHFTAVERLNNVPIECRLLTQPVDRYQSPAEKIVDGAIFAYANGTNPELGVVFETNGGRWLYGIVRLTSAEATVALDGRQVAAFERFNPRGDIYGPYHSAAFRIDRGK
jgi:hypothetical protein